MSRISQVTITPVAFADPPLLNAVGVHQPFALRAIIEIVTDDGLTGLGETYADTGHLASLRAAASAIEGADVYHTEEIYRRVAAIAAPDTRIASGLIGHSAATDRVFSPFEVACLDIQGKAAGRPVADLLGGGVRDEVPFSAYLFYKWAAHPGAEPDDWGEALDPDGIVAQARRMIDEYGFTAIKLKGGVFPPAAEIEAVRALRDAFPSLPLRLDPNAAWTPETSLGVARDLDGVLEYLEDPTPGIDGMASVAREAPMPLATNMCVVAFGHLPPAIRADAVQVVLSDHHYWGGLRRSKLLAGICETFGIGLSMHSNSHLGISLAAMVHLAAATPNLSYACDTHWPWKTEDVVRSPVTFNRGAVRVPDGPGLGVELDRDALGTLHEQYLKCGIRDRDDTGYMRMYLPDFEPPRWLRLARDPAPLDVGRVHRDRTGRAPLVFSHQARLEQFEIAEERENLVSAPRPDPLAGFLIDRHRFGQLLLVRKKLGADVRDRQVTARCDRVPQGRHDPDGIIAVRQEMQDREQADRHRLPEIQVLAHRWHREQLAGAAQVGLDHNAAVLDRQQGLPVRDHDRVVVGVDNSCVRIGLVGHLVHGALRRQSDADIEELADARFRCGPHYPAQEPPVLHRCSPQAGN
jgi:glucarate dehydratase